MAQSGCQAYPYPRLLMQYRMHAVLVEMFVNAIDQKQIQAQTIGESEQGTRLPPPRRERLGVGADSPEAPRQPYG